MNAFKLFQGYLWFPKTLEFDPIDALPKQLGEVHVMLDTIRPPFAFFENGTMTETQHFFQLTLILRTEKESHDLKEIAKQVSDELNVFLNATPKDVGWQLMEDLRPVYFD